MLLLEIWYHRKSSSGLPVVLLAEDAHGDSCGAGMLCPLHPAGECGGPPGAHGGLPAQGHLGGGPEGGCLPLHLR